MVITIQPFLRYLTTNIIKGQKVLAINAYYSKRFSSFAPIKTLLYETDKAMDADHHPYFEWSDNADIVFE